MTADGSRHTAPAEARYGVRTRKALEDLVRFAASARALIQRGKSEYDADETLRLAAEAIASRIGEAVVRLDPSLVSDHPEIPFREARDMRNLVAHHYDRIDADIVWETLRHDLPAFARQVEALLSD